MSDKEDNTLLVSDLSTDETKTDKTGRWITAHTIKQYRLLCACFVCVLHGSVRTAPATALIDLITVFQSTIQWTSLGLSMTKVGAIPGSFFGAYVGKRFLAQADMVLALFSLVEAVSFALSPCFPSVLCFGVLCFVAGMVHGIKYTVAQTLVIADWEEDATRPLNILGFCYAVGCLIGPLYTAPFLTTKGSESYLYSNGLEGTHLNSSMHSSSNLTRVSVTEYPDVTFINDTDVRSRVIVPFVIVGVLLVLSGFSFWILTLPSFRAVIREMKSPLVENESNNSTEKTKKLLLAMSMFFIIKALIPWRGTVIRTYVVYIAVESSVHMPVVQAALLNSVQNACWAFGHLFGVSKCVSINVMAFGYLICTVICGVFLSIFGLRAEILLWAFLCLFSVFSGPMDPCIISWVNQYTPVDSYMMSVAGVADSVGCFAGLFLGGVVLENLGCDYIFVIVTLTSALIIIPMIILRLTIGMDGPRFKFTKPESGEGNEGTPLVK